MRYITCTTAFQANKNTHKHDEQNRHKTAFSLLSACQMNTTSVMMFKLSTFFPFFSESASNDYKKSGRENPIQITEALRAAGAAILAKQLLGSIFAFTCLPATSILTTGSKERDTGASTHTL